MAWETLTGIPDLAEIRAWIDVPATELPDGQLALIREAELEVQEEFCELPDDAETLPYALAQALLRRCARAVAARGIPLGTLPAQMTGTPVDYGVGLTFGAHYIPQLDAEVERYEAAWRVIAVA
ncbi:MAG: hypothetical protein J2P28_11120 [Actinobacteria bacterium]|nr:hypothetical protein [Actinomycetota bacterium]